MKKLILMRHAKSSWAEPLQEDFDRTLNDRGKADAPEMGERLVQKSIMPDLIICSAAKRTHKTAKLIAAVLKYEEKDIARELGLYESDIRDYIDVIRQIDDKYETVLLIGHNPTITAMVGYLTSTNIPNMPTAGQVHVTFNITSWKQVAQNNASFNWFDFPKNSDE